MDIIKSLFKLTLLALFLFIVSKFFIFKKEEVLFEQPINFNHSIHISQGMGCEDCHQYVKKEEFAGIPNIETCESCHSDSLSESSEEKKLIDSIKGRNPIKWVKVNNLPDHTYFSHRIHVVTGKINCSECHGNMEERKNAVNKPYREFSMKWCISCHVKKTADVDCIVCHR
ncbi:MAG: cytochrome c3 family protein [Acidobacteriota bacterium]